MNQLTKLIPVALLALPLLVVAEDRSNPDVAAVVKGNTEFAVKLYAKLRDKEGNLFLSPYSISTALAMTYAGARDNTASQMKEALCFPFATDRLSPAYRALIAQTEPSKGYELSVANALWCQVGFGLLDAYVRVIEEDYQAGLKAVDFVGDTEGARQTINEWVKKETKDKIKELLKPGILTFETRLVLTNAIYFKGNWASQFKKEATKDEPFITATGKVDVPMMHQKGTFAYLDAGTFQVLEMPYVGKELSMVIFLPKKPDGLAEFEQSLSPDKLAHWLGNLREQEVFVSLPRFKVTGDSFSLKEHLKALGMKDAFDPYAADFSGIIGRKGLYIQDAVHKAFIEVNEEGTEAAAATAVIIGIRGARIVPVFKADHPFFFIIRDRRNGSILFMGRLVDPKQS